MFQTLLRGAGELHNFVSGPVSSGQLKDMWKEEQFWLVTTEHLEDRLWFRDDEDFKVGMNYVAVQASIGPASVLAFILMSNHVHFVLHGTHDDVRSFINSFKMRYAKYYQHKYGQKEFLRRNGIDIRVLPADDEALERAVAYVHMNSVAANICANASQYPWGSGSLLFNGIRDAGTPVGELSQRQQALKLHCSHAVPGSWLMGKDGYILLQSYIDVSFMERIFRSPKRMNYFLASSSKARKRIECGEDNRPSFRDQIVADALPDLCRTLYGCSSLAGLTYAQTVEVLRQIRFRFASNVNQIARVTNMSYNEVAKLLDQA